MTTIRELPRVRDHWGEVEGLLRGHTPVVFLDFDGTLAPIVDDPAAARLPDPARAAIAELGVHGPVVVVSGRDAEDVRERVGLHDVVYAGSHGFDVLWPDGRRTERGTDHRDRLALAVDRLRAGVAGVPGVEVEPKRYAVAVHHRRTPPARVAEIETAIEQVARDVGGLRRSGGKQVVELRPDLDWDKGRTLLWVLAELELDAADAVPVYVGDDLTDEDAFAALRRHGRGLGLVVRGEADDRATAADYAIDDVAETPRVLQALCRLLTGAPEGDDSTR